MKRQPIKRIALAVLQAGIVIYCVYDFVRTMYASNTGGKVFVVDANNGAGQTLARTYNLGLTALGDISRDPEFGRIYVASAGGRLYAIDSFADPTPGAP